jgi:hypothetical protein
MKGSMSTPAEHHAAQLRADAAAVADAAPVPKCTSRGRAARSGGALAGLVDAVGRNLRRPSREVHASALVVVDAVDRAQNPTAQRPLMPGV